MSAQLVTQTSSNVRCYSSIKHFVSENAMLFKDVNNIFAQIGKTSGGKTQFKHEQNGRKHEHSAIQTNRRGFPSNAARTRFSSSGFGNKFWSMLAFREERGISLIYLAHAQCTTPFSCSLQGQQSFSVVLLLQAHEVRFTHVASFGGS